MEWWKEYFIKPFNLSGYGIYHPSRTEPFEFPHSGLLTAYTHRCDILVPQRKLSARKSLLIDEPWVPKMLKKNKGAVMRWCIRDRSNVHQPSQLYTYADDYGDDFNHDAFDEDDKLKPKPIVMLNSNVTRPDEEDDDQESSHPAHGSTIKTMKDVCDRIESKAKGRGRMFAICERDALIALNCYKGGNRRVAPDAEQRQDLYSKAKYEGHIEYEGDTNKGFKVWVAGGDKINDEAWRTRGGQDD